MALAKTEKEWAERAARHIKAELKRAADAPTMSTGEVACRVFVALHGPRAKRRKVA